MAIPHNLVGSYRIMQGMCDEINQEVTFFKTADGQFCARVCLLDKGVPSAESYFSETQIMVLLKNTEDCFRRISFCEIEERKEIFQLLNV